MSNGTPLQGSAMLWVMVENGLEKDKFGRGETSREATVR